MKTLTGKHNAYGLRIAVVVAKYNEKYTEKLKEGAISTLVDKGIKEEDLKLVYVPGSFELAIACKALALTGKYGGIVAIGVVIRSATTHYDHVCNAMTDGINLAMLETGVPIGYGTATVENAEQAEERCGGIHGNRGTDAALAAIEMANLLKEIRA